MRYKIVYVLHNNNYQLYVHRHRDRFIVYTNISDIVAACIAEHAIYQYFSTKFLNIEHVYNNTLRDPFTNINILVKREQELHES